MDIIAQAKAHPYVAGGIAIVGVGALYLLMSSGSGGAVAATNSGTDPAVAAASISADAQLQAAGIQAGVINNQTQSQTTLGLAYLKQQTDITNSTNSAQLEALRITTGAQLNEDLILATEDIAINSPVVTNKSGGFLGIGKKTTTAQINQNAAYSVLSGIGSSIGNVSGNGSPTSSSVAGPSTPAATYSSSIGDGAGAISGNQTGLA